MTLHAENLSCIRQDRLIFDKLTFSVAPGSVLWIKGKNGAGKSSLLRIVAGLLKQAEGDILWKGENVRTEPDCFAGQFRYIGHQEPLKPVLSVEENLKFWTEFAGRDDVDKALEEFELLRIKETPARILSAGQKKRTNLARLIAAPAPLWILDEPVSSLDSHYIDLFCTHLTRHIAAGGMALLATHQDLNLESTEILNLDKQEGSL
ncbi:MAG: heme ABC exporter ATP-binding protein CcmA [Sneathiella sp.]